MCTKENILTGYLDEESGITTFQPLRSMTRAEVCKVMREVLDKSSL